MVTKHLYLPDKLSMITETLELGTVISEPVEIKPGSVPVWKLSTNQGDFHVKVWLNGEWDWLIASINSATEIEMAAHAYGVEMAEPIALNRRFGASIFSVHRWHEGRTLQSTDDVALWLGRMLVKLHAIPPPACAPRDAIESWYGVHPVEEWQEWIVQAEEQALPWAQAARNGLPKIQTACELVAEGLCAGGRIVGSHRDLMGQNVLAANAGFMLIDWDCAGPEIAWLETVRAGV